MKFYIALDLLEEKRSTFTCYFILEIWHTQMHSISDIFSQSYNYKNICEYGCISLHWGQRKRKRSIVQNQKVHYFVKVGKSVWTDHVQPMSLSRELALKLLRQWIPKWMYVGLSWKIFIGLQLWCFFFFHHLVWWMIFWVMIRMSRVL